MLRDVTRRAGAPSPRGEGLHVARGHPSTPMAVGGDAVAPSVALAVAIDLGTWDRILFARANFKTALAREGMTDNTPFDHAAETRLLRNNS